MMDTSFADRMVESHSRTSIYVTQGISFSATKDRHREILCIDIVCTDRSTTLYELELLIARYS